MKKFIVTAAVTGATLFMISASVKATEVIYGFDSPSISGFTKSYDQDGTATLSESTTTGVTQGSGALHIAVAPTGGGYDQIDAATSTVPADLVAPGTASLSLDAAGNYNNAAYITVAPAFFIDGTTDGSTAFGTKLLYNSKTLPYDGGVPTDHTYTYSLLIKDPYATAKAANPGTGQPATPADGDSATATYTPGHILAQVLSAFQAANPNATASIDGFALEETTNTAPDSGTGTPVTDLGDDLYIDNVTVPVTATPEPASLAGIAIGGLLLARRRRHC